MRRWQQRSVWRSLKKGLISLLVCALVLILPVLALRQWYGDAKLVNDAHAATPLPAFVDRPADINKSAPQLYKEPLISITFDDGWETTHTVAGPILARNGIHSTQYLATGLLNNPAYLSTKQVEAFRDQGHQITCHSVSHPNLTGISTEKLNYELRGCQQYLREKKLGKAEDFAAPYGRTNPAVINGIKQVFRSERNTNGSLVDEVNEADINLPNNTNPYDIIGVTVHYDTTVEQLRAAVDYAIAHNGWLVLTYHQAEEKGSKFSLDSGSLRKQLDYLSGAPVRIVTVGQVMDNLPEAPRN